ncbi:uncharacterized protein LOC141532585 [Cotesia typhae]|uniref:uncharacterized protein LOC141532585 n=1 Tax=Cotesia typhae TaxID=2053667 RepID=UPI003D68EFF9
MFCLEVGPFATYLAGFKLIFFCNYYSTEIKKWLRSHPGRVVTPNDIPDICCEALKQAGKANTIINGFKKTGIYPFNRNAFTEDEFVQVRASVKTESNYDENKRDESNESSNSQALDQIGKSLSLILVESDDDETVSTSTENYPTAQHSINSIECDNVTTPEPVAHCSTSAPPTNSRTRGFFRPCVPYPSSEDEEEITKAPPALTPNKFISRRKRDSVNFTVLPKSIGPGAVSTGNKDVVPRKKRARGKTAILTDIEYRNELSQRQQQSSKKSVGKGRDRPRKVAKDPDGTSCIYCQQKYSELTESWIQCQDCKKWAHDLCAGITDEDIEFICDYC